MKELEKYSLSDLFHIKQYAEKKLEDAPDVRDYERYQEEYPKWSKENSSLITSAREVRYEIEDRMEKIFKNIEIEFNNA